MPALWLTCHAADTPQWPSAAWAGAQGKSLSGLLPRDTCWDSGPETFHLKCSHWLPVGHSVKCPMTEAHETILKPAIPTMPWGMLEKLPNGGQCPSVPPAVDTASAGTHSARPSVGVEVTFRQHVIQAASAQPSCVPSSTRPSPQLLLQRSKAKPQNPRPQRTSHGPSVSHETHARSVKNPDTCLSSFWP